MENSGYDAFVSYRRSDGAQTARWVRNALQGFRLPRQLRERYNRKLRVYLDTAYERGTADFYGRTIRPALMSSQWLIIVATPDAVTRGEDDWIQREVRDFCEGPNGHNVIVVRGAGEFDGPLPGDLEARFPHIQIVDLRGVGRFWYLNPLKASRVSNELLKLVAPVLEVEAADMPQLRQEEERRQHARLGAAFGGASGVAVAIAALAIFALISRYQAQSALQDSIYSLSQLVRQSYRAPAFDQPNGIEAGQTASRGCDLLANLDGTAGERAPVETRSLCLVVQGDGRIAQREFDLAEAHFHDALAMVEAAMARKPTEQLADAGLRVRDAFVRLHVATDDKAEQESALEAIIAECERLMTATRIDGNGAGETATQASHYYEDRAYLHQRVGSARLELARLAAEAGNANVRLTQLQQASEAFAAVVKERIATAGSASGSDAGIASALDDQADIEADLSAIALNGQDTAGVMRHLDRAIELRKQIAGREGAPTKNSFELGRLLAFASGFKPYEQDRARLVIDAKANLNAALQRNDLSLNDARHAVRLLREIKNEAVQQ